MTKIELEPQQAVELLSAASIGKLITGLVHNLNGPLHSLGIEMDVMGFLFSKNQDLDSEFANNFSTRLKRMEEEFDKLNGLIRQTADRAEAFSSPPPALINFNYLIKEELEFLNANLYFKHRVETTLDIDENAKGVKPRSDYLCLSFRWLMQALVEDIERNKIEQLRIKTRGEPEHFVVWFATQASPFSPEILGSTGYEPAEGIIGASDIRSIEILLAISLLKSSGVLFSQNAGNDHSEISLALPYE